MLNLTSADIIRIVTDSTATTDVHASWVDRVLATSADTPSSTNTAISSATTTTVIAAPASGSVRNVRRLVVRNRSAATSVTVTVQLYNGATAYELDKRTLGPGSALIFDDAFGFLPTPAGGNPTLPWYGVLAGAQGRGDPNEMLLRVQSASNIAATPTNISTSIARCCSFMLPFDLTFNRIRAFGVGVTTNVYRVAVYRMSDLARLTAELAFTTAVDTWVSIGSALNITLSKDVAYFMAVAVNATGTTPGLTCMGGTIAATTGRINTIPASLPGSLSMGATNYQGGFQFQFAVTTGALPATAATLAAQAAWTGGMPAFWLDSADT